MDTFKACPVTYTRAHASTHLTLNTHNLVFVDLQPLTAHISDSGAGCQGDEAVRVVAHSDWTADSEHVCLLWFKLKRTVPEL